MLITEAKLAVRVCLFQNPKRNTCGAIFPRLKSTITLSTWNTFTDGPNVDDDVPTFVHQLNSGAYIKVGKVASASPTNSHTIGHVLGRRVLPVANVRTRRLAFEWLVCFVCFQICILASS